MLRRRVPSLLAREDLGAERSLTSLKLARSPHTHRPPTSAPELSRGHPASQSCPRLNLPDFTTSSLDKRSNSGERAVKAPRRRPGPRRPPLARPARPRAHALGSRESARPGGLAVHREGVGRRPTGVSARRRGRARRETRGLARAARRARLAWRGSHRRSHPGNPRLVRRSPPRNAFPTPPPPPQATRARS